MQTGSTARRTDDHAHVRRCAVRPSHRSPPAMAPSTCTARQGRNRRQAGCRRPHERRNLASSRPWGSSLLPRWSSAGRPRQRTVFNVPHRTHRQVDFDMRPVGTNAMSQDQLAWQLVGSQAYADAVHFEAVRKAVADVLGFAYAWEAHNLLGGVKLVVATMVDSHGPRRMLDGSRVIENVSYVRPHEVAQQMRSIAELVYHVEDMVAADAAAWRPSDAHRSHEGSGGTMVTTRGRSVWRIADPEPARNVRAVQSAGRRNGRGRTQRQAGCWRGTP